ncbi:MAG: tRNA1(Val) (adenine(37)-N6)-methyltransferase [Candidatus Binatales bacterium]
MKQPRHSETLDSILGGRLRILQPRDGYRFSVDAILLGRFARARRRDRVLELGAGCGVVSMMLAALYGAREVVALEIQPAMAALIARNAGLNALAQISAVCADLREPTIASLGSFDLVVANPPYRARHTGRESPNPGRRIARGSAEGSLADFIGAAARYARFGATIAIVFAASRSAELIALMRAHGLEPKRIRFVHPRLGLPASTILVAASKGGGIEVKIEPPLAMYSEPGVYSAEAREWLEGFRIVAGSGNRKAGRVATGADAGHYPE